MNKPYVAILFGNCLTKYNQALFSLLAPVWAVSFFNGGNSLDNLIFTYSFFIVDWIARPLGAFFWGWLADYYGIPKALLSSFLGVTMATICLGIFPLFCVSNGLAFTLMFIIRLLYSFSATGETTNGAIFLLKKSSAYQSNWISSLYDISSTMGSLLAAIMMLIFHWNGYLKHQWNGLFYFSSILCGIGLLLRLHIPAETIVQKNRTIAIPFKALLYHHWTKLLALMAASGFSHAIYTFSFVLIQGYIPLVVTTISYQRLLQINIILICLDVILLPILARCANIWGHRYQMLGATMITILSMPILFYLMEQATATSIFCCRIWIMVLGVAFSCTYHAWAHSLLPADSQYRLSALGYTLGSRFIGMPILVIGPWLFQKTFLVGAPLLYLGATAVMAAIALYSTKA